MGTLQAAISNVQGRVGVAAKDIKSGREVTHDATDLFFTASTFKVPLLLELFNQVDQGKVDLDASVELTDGMRVPGSGVLKELGAGLAPTVRDLATLMIIISDNAATDVLYNLIGGGAIHMTLDRLGLRQTRIPMTTRQLLYSIAGMDPENSAHTYRMASDRLFLRQLVPEADGFSEERSDVSSPADMCRLLEMVLQGEVLSPESRAGFLDIMGHQQLNTLIPLKLPAGTRAAHKTGSYHGVRCDVGVVYAPWGPYVVAIMAKQVTGEPLETDLALAEVSKAVYDGFSSSS